MALPLWPHLLHAHASSTLILVGSPEPDIIHGSAKQTCITVMAFFAAARPQCARCRLDQQLRHASLLRRPKRPYTFTQLITLSDGSTFLHRTTSPQPIYRTVKDTKNSALWNPSSQKLLNVEEDEAGRLRRFRRRFGRGFDAEALASKDGVSVLGAHGFGRPLG